MDVVYVIGTGSKWDNNELRYSLRSIEKYGHNVDRVIIVGYCPDWVNRDIVEYIPAEDETKVPAINVFRKISKVWGKVSGHFLLFNDDIFLKGPVDLDRYPVYSKGDMPTPLSVRTIHFGDKRYTNMLLATADIMRRNNLGTTMYSHHAPLHFDYRAYVILELAGVWKELEASERGLSMANLMVSAYVSLDKVPTVPRCDVKLHHLNTPEDLKELDGTDIFSIYDSAIHTGVANYLEKLFPSPCRFEKI